MSWDLDQIEHQKRLMAFFLWLPLPLHHVSKKEMKKKAKVFRESDQRGEQPHHRQMVDCAEPHIDTYGARSGAHIT